MPRHNQSGPPKGRRSSSRSNASGKSFSKKSDSPPFKKSPRSDSSKPSFSRGREFPENPRSSGGPFSRSSKSDSSFRPLGGGKSDQGENSGKRPYRKFDGDQKPRPSERRSSFSGGGKEERPYKKFDKPAGKSPFKRESKPPYDKGGSSGTDRPYKKFDRADSGKSSFREEKPAFKKRDSSSSESSRPYKKFDRDGGKPSFREEKPAYKKRDSSTSESSRPYKKFDRSAPADKPFSKRNEGASDKSDFRASKPPYKKFDRDSERPSRRTPETEGGSFKKRDSGYVSKKFKSENFKGKPTPAVDAKPSDGKIRLNKFIANSGVCSRREADELIKMGLISVNGKTITELGFKVNPGDEVRHESKVLKAEKPVYILLNKPKGFLTTTVDPQERNTVMHLIGNVVKERVYPVGRLDRNTTGLLLLTNDGDLAEKLMHPSYNVKKIYKVELDRPLTKADAQRILDGVKLEEGRAIVDDLAIVSDDRKTIGLEIHIGWNRVVRRIFESLEYDVVKLDRSVYAGLNKKDLGRGEWRFLKKEELVLLKHFQ